MIYRLNQKSSSKPLRKSTERFKTYHTSQTGSTSSTIEFVVIHFRAATFQEDQHFLRFLSSTNISLDRTKSKFMQTIKGLPFLQPTVSQIYKAILIDFIQCKSFRNYRIPNIFSSSRGGEEWVWLVKWLKQGPSLLMKQLKLFTLKFFKEFKTAIRRFKQHTKTKGQTFITHN